MSRHACAPRLRYLILIVLLLGLPLGSSGSDIEVSLLKDINPGRASSGVHVSVSLVSPLDNDRAANADGLAFFIANDGVSGYEPWVSDGTEEGTRLLKDVAPGAASSNNASRADDFFYHLGEDTYFHAKGLPQLEQFWRTDGTPEGTELVLNATSIADWDYFQDSFWFLVQLVGAPSHEFLRTTDFVQFDRIPFQHAASFDVYQEKGMVLVERIDPEEAADNATVWKTTNGEDFELYWDPSTTLDEHCTKIIFASVPAPWNDEFCMLHCANTGFYDTWALALSDNAAAVGQVPDAHKLLSNGAIKLRLVDETNNHLYYSQRSGTKLFRFDGTQVDLIVETQADDDDDSNATAAAPPSAFLQYASFLPSRENTNQIYYMVESKPVGGTEWIEFWKVDVTTLETERLWQLSGLELGTVITLSDHRAVMVTENHTHVEFWDLGYSFTLLESVHLMDVSNWNNRSFFNNHFTYLNPTTVLVAGFDNEHGRELWKLTYQPQDGTAPITTTPADASSSASACFSFGKLLGGLLVSAVLAAAMTILSGL